MIYNDIKLVKIKILLLNPDNLEILKEWITNSESKQKYKNLFMIDEILYGTDNSSPIKIVYSFNIRNKQSNEHIIKTFKWNDY